MTNDELLYSMNEMASAWEDARLALETRLRGKLVKYYGDRVFRVTKVTAEVWRGGTAYVVLKGPMLKKDGTPHAKNEGSMKFENAEFV